MTDTARRILPKNATAFERAHVDNQIAAWDLVDPSIIEVEGDPTLCDANLLSVLGYDKGQTFWSDDWSVAQQRDYIRNLWIYKLLEGTPLGAEVYLNLAGGMLIDEVLPPNNSFLISDDGLSHQQVLDLMPQIRLYYHWPETKPSGDYLFIGRDAFGGNGSLIPDQTGTVGRYTVLYDPETGIETPLDVDQVEQTSVTVSLTGKNFAGWAFYVGGQSFFGRDLFGMPYNSAPITFDLDDLTLTTQRNSPPMRSQQDVIGQSFVGQAYFSNDIGDIGTYDRLYVQDASRIPSGISGARAAMFIGPSWFGIPAYNQILTIAVTGNPSAIPMLWGFIGQGYIIDANAHPQLDLALSALNTAKRGGDRVLVSLAPTFAGARMATLPDITDLSK